MTEVRGDFGIGVDTSVETLAGLEELRRVTGRLQFVNNPRLRSLEGLDNLEEIGELYIGDNPQLVSLGLPRLLRIDPWGITLGTCSTVTTDEPAIMRGSNGSFTGFDGLESLRSVGGDGLVIYGQESLSSLDGLRQLADAGAQFGFLTVGGNPQLAAAEIESFVAVADLIGVEACQNRDDDALCHCPVD